MSLVTFKNVSAYVAGSSGPGIILLQEWWGLNEQIKRISDKFAAEGFIVCAPDLYHGKVAKDANEANHYMSGLDFQAAVDECGVWQEYLTKEKKCQKVGVTGFCMGGALTIACASKLGSRMNAASVFYGIPDMSYFPVSSITAPLLLNFGKKDDLKGFSDPENVGKLTEKLKAENKKFDINWYPEASHAFMNDTRPEVYREADAKDAFAKTIKFFKQHLQ